MDLLSDDSRSDSEGDVSRPQSDPQLKINRRFAESFERRERFKELDKLKHLEEDDDSDSEEESEDDDGEGLTSAIEVKILNTINSLRKKDPKIYDQSTTWFENESSESEEDDTDEVGQKKKKRFKDVLREQLLSTGAGSDDENALTSKKSSAITLKTRSLAYDKEQEKLRRDFLKSVQSNAESDDGSDDEDADGNILVVKKKSQEELAREEEEVKKALEEMKKLGRLESNSSGKSSKTKGVKSKSSSVDNTSSANDADVPVVDPDTFLADYIANKKWKSSNIVYADGSDDDKVGDDDEDEEALEAAEQFESTYNFRFEELQDSDKLTNVQVIGHSRSVEGSMRRADDKRKTQRELRKERKEKERRQKEAEIRRLKNLKRQELEERLKKISEVGGLEELGLDETALEEDWDPSKHEAMMKQQFGEDYYEGEDQNFDLSNQDIDQWLLEVDDEEAEEAEYNLEGHYVDDLDEGQNGKSKKKKAKKGKKEDIDALLDKGSKSSVLAANMLDELYQLDYEDIVAGIPCRFKYKEVEPEDFGLSTDDILLADDADLNKIVSLKKLSTYNNLKMSTDEIRKIKKRSKKLRRTLQDKLKQTEKEIPEAAETAAIAAADAAAIGDEGNSNEGGDGEKRKRRRRKKKGGSVGDADAAEDAEADASDAPATTTAVSVAATAVALASAVAASEVEEVEGDKAGKRKRRKKRSTDSMSNNHSNDNSRHKKNKGTVVDEKKQRLGLYM